MKTTVEIILNPAILLSPKEITNKEEFITEFNSGKEFITVGSSSFRRDRIDYYNFIDTPDEIIDVEGNTINQS